MYEQNLYEVIKPIRSNTISRLNKSKKWEYGYNKEHDVVVISKNGTIGDVYSIQGLKIALPKSPKKCHTFTTKKWEVTPYPKELNSTSSNIDKMEINYLSERCLVVQAANNFVLFKK